MAPLNDLVRLAAEQASAAYDKQNATCGQGVFTAALFGRRLCKIAGIKQKLLPPELVRVVLAGRSDIVVQGGLYYQLIR